MAASRGERYQAFKRRLYWLLHRPLIELLIIAFIAASVTLFVIEVGLPKGHPAYFWVVDVGELLTLGFVVELVVRFWLEPRKSRFFRRYWLDIIAVLPALRAFRIVRVVRLVRLFRVGVLLHRRLRSVSSSLAAGIGMQLGLMLNIGIVVLVGATLIHLLEGTNPQFDSLIESMWWAFFTVVAGEPVGAMPQSFAGKLVTSFVALGGLTMFAVFTGIVSAVMVQKLRLGLEVKDMELADVREHTVICGWNRAAPLIMKELLAESLGYDQHIVCVAEMDEPSDAEFANVDRSRVHYLKGDYTRPDVLETAGIKNARRALLLADKSVSGRSDQDRDARTVLAALTIEKINKSIITCAQLLDRMNNPRLQHAGVEEVVIGDEVSGHLMATAVRDEGLASFFRELLSVQVGNQLFKVALPQRLAGRAFGEIVAEVKGKSDCLVVALQTADGEVHVNPSREREVAGAERLLVIARKEPRL